MSASRRCSRSFVHLIGWRLVALTYFPAMYVAASGGIWLFYVQHQFDTTYWAPHPDWDYFTAAIRGSSYLRLPWLLRWFTGDIGVHHVHHLSPRIPNYRLRRCHDENPIFHSVTVLTWRDGFRAFRSPCGTRTSRGSSASPISTMHEAGSRF